MNLRSSLFALGALGILAPSAHAVTVVNENFNSGFVAGSIVGQKNYLVDGATGSAYNYTATGGRSGSGGVTINTDPQLAAGYAYQDLNYGVTAANPLLSFSVDVASIGFATGAGGTTTSRFGLQVYSATALLANLDFRFTSTGTTQAVYRYQSSGTALTTVNFTGAAAANTFKTLGVTINTTTNAVNYSIDGAAVGTYTYDATTDDSIIGDIDLYSSPIGYDTGSYDNLSFTANPVPEPSAFAALGLGAVAVLRRRKRA